jgi:hypothetical protein
MRKKTSIRTQSSSVWSNHRHDDDDCEVLGGPLCRSVVQLWARGRALEPVAAVERPTQKSVAASFDCVAHGTFSIRRHLAIAATKSGTAVQLAAAKETSMDTNTLLIILIILVVFGGGGFYGRGRWW